MKGDAVLQPKWIALAVLAPAAWPPATMNRQDQERYKSPWRTPWTYEQAAYWGQLDPLYSVCSTGTSQSPIDIRNAQKEHLPALHIEFRNFPLKHVINNGHTIRVNYPESSGRGDVLSVGDNRYQLTQFHFHHPSEEQIDGKPYEMEAHFMYQAADGAVAGVAVFIIEGASNRTMQQLWQHMPRVEGQTDVTGIIINPSDLIPQHLGYYQYTGSQTAPPCTEPVTWYVLKTPVEASRDQIEAFAELYPHNVRPVQPLNGRMILESQ